MLPITAFIIIPTIFANPLKNPAAPDVLNENADFGTPSDHDNKVATEIQNGLDSVQIAHLMSVDYFTNSTLPCDNITAPGSWMIYCSGRLLQAVMTVKLYNDSKTFVDRPMKKNTTGEMILEEFNTRFPGPLEDLSRDDVKTFVDEFFDREGQELDVCKLIDWKPQEFESVADETYRELAKRLHFIWIHLCRQMKKDVRDEPERFSLLYVPNSFILPGGRFREFYYWDAYWIIKGLLRSQMYTTARNMIKNFAHVINTYGFIPNGGRVYYLRRSQPPFFAPMVYDYFMATNDLQFVSDMVPIIEKEYLFWTEKRGVNVKIDEEDLQPIKMFQYRTEAETPRPESFREDVISAGHLNTTTERRKFFQDVGSAAESGWDFSSRWFRDRQNLTTVETTNIVPVDLNAFICYNMNILAFFYEQLENPIKQNEWSTKYKQFRDSFGRVFYVPSRKGWYDYNLRTRSHNTDFYPTIAAPLFTQCYDPLNYKLAADLYTQIKSMGALEYEGGIPTSLHKTTHQQWDFPNGWSPLNHMVIEGLRKSINPTLQQAAYTIAEKWLHANLVVFNASNAMWEKYDVAHPDSRLATGGEYEVQAGFGWTNGAALDLILTYSDRLKYAGDRLVTLLGTELPPTDNTTDSSSKVQSTTPKITTTSVSTPTTSVPTTISSSGQTQLFTCLCLLLLYIF